MSGSPLIMPGGAFCISMSQSTPSLTGSSNNSEKHSRRKATCATWYSIAVRASVGVWSPWGNRSVCSQQERRTGALGRTAVAERWIGSVRRELLDQVVVFNERHLRRLLNEYVAYYHDDRTHDALAEETPAGRRPAVPQVPCSTAVSRPRLGGLNHRYEAAV